MNRAGYLLKNMSLFTVSNMASKLIVFLLVPFYTNVLTEGEYGIADVMQASLLLLVPLLSINAGEAALRFGIEEEYKRGAIFKSGMKHVLTSVFAVVLVCAGLSCTVFSGEIRTYFLFFALLYACNAFYEFMLLYTQGCEKVQIMVTGSVFCTAVTVISNLILLLVVRIGLYGYILSQVVAYFLAGILMLCLLGAGSLLRSDEDMLLKREMTKYGRGMLLYSTASWANNAIDRYFILFMQGTEQNGLYGAAYKIPAILTVFQRIFAQSFQMSATKNYKEEDSGAFFGSLYELYNGVMLTGCAFLLLILKPLSAFMFRKGFIEAWIMVPPLLISVIFGALEGYLGSICLAHKDGKSMGIATGVGALVNIIFNYLGIMVFGTIGAAYATLISYFTMFVIAYGMVSKHVRLEVNIKRDALGYFLIFCAGFITMYGGDIAYFADMLIMVFIMILYRDRIIFIKEKLGIGRDKEV